MELRAISFGGLMDGRYNASAIPQKTVQYRW